METNVHRIFKMYMVCIVLYSVNEIKRASCFIISGLRGRENREVHYQGRRNSTAALSQRGIFVQQFAGNNNKEEFE